MRSDESSRSTLGQYLRDVSRVPLLTIEKGRDLARKLRSGDERAGHRPVETSLEIELRALGKLRQALEPIARELAFASGTGKIARRRRRGPSATA